MSYARADHTRENFRSLRNQWCISVWRRKERDKSLKTGGTQELPERSNMVLVGTPNDVVNLNCIKRLPTNRAKDPEIHPSLPLGSDSWRCPERARRGAHHGRQ